MRSSNLALLQFFIHDTFLDRVDPLGQDVHACVVVAGEETVERETKRATPSFSGQINLSQRVPIEEH